MRGVQKWEYQAQIVIPEHFRQGVDSYRTFLNEFGAAGWEAVNLLAEGQTAICAYSNAPLRNRPPASREAAPHTNKPIQSI